MKIINFNEIEFDSWKYDDYLGVSFLFDDYIITFENVYFNFYEGLYEMRGDKAIINEVYDKNGKLLKDEELKKAIKILKTEYNAKIEE